MGKDADRLNSRHASVRRSYDAVAADYAIRFRDELAAKPLDRALLACLAGQVEGTAPIADLGCGPGRARNHPGGGIGRRAAFSCPLCGAVPESRQNYPRLGVVRQTVTDI